MGPITSHKEPIEIGIEIEGATVWGRGWKGSPHGERIGYSIDKKCGISILECEKDTSVDSHFYFSLVLV